MAEEGGFPATELLSSPQYVVPYSPVLFLSREAALAMKAGAGR